jgi:hypothetical protein
MKSFVTALMFLLPFSCATIDQKPLHYGCPGPKGGVKAGKTVLLVDVNESGKAENIRILESSPQGMWDDASICIAKKGVFVNNEAGDSPPFKNHKLYFNMNLTDQGAEK